MILYSYLFCRVGKDAFPWVSFVSLVDVIRMLQDNLDAGGSWMQQFVSIALGLFFGNSL